MPSGQGALAQSPSDDRSEGTPTAQPHAETPTGRAWQRRIAAGGATTPGESHPPTHAMSPLPALHARSTGCAPHNYRNSSRLPTATRQHAGIHTLVAITRDAGVDPPVDGQRQRLVERCDCITGVGHCPREHSWKTRLPDESVRASSPTPETTSEAMTSSSSVSLWKTHEGGDSVHSPSSNPRMRCASRRSPSVTLTGSRAPTVIYRHTGVLIFGTWRRSRAITRARHGTGMGGNGPS
jgi:hypothetical protein